MLELILCGLGYQHCEAAKRSSLDTDPNFVLDTTKEELVVSTSGILTMDLRVSSC